MNILKFKTKESGMSLVEVSLSAVAMSLISGAFISWIYVDSKHKQNVIDGQIIYRAQSALDAFGFINSKLPCPSQSNDGIAKDVCSDGKEGFFPYLSVGISDTRFGTLKYKVANGAFKNNPSLTDIDRSLLQLLYVKSLLPNAPSMGSISDFSVNYGFNSSTSANNFLFFCAALSFGKNNDFNNEDAYSLRIENKNFYSIDYLFKKSKLQLIDIYNCPSLFSSSARMHLNAVAAADVMKRSQDALLPIASLIIGDRAMKLSFAFIALMNDVSFKLPEAVKKLIQAIENLGSTSNSSLAVKALQGVKASVAVLNPVNELSAIAKDVSDAALQASNIAYQLSVYLFAQNLSSELEVLINKSSRNAVSNIESGIGFPYSFDGTFRNESASSKTDLKELRELNQKLKAAQAELIILNEMYIARVSLIKKTSDVFSSQATSTSLISGSSVLSVTGQNDPELQLLQNQINRKKDQITDILKKIKNKDLSLDVSNNSSELTSTGVKSYFFDTFVQSSASSVFDVYRNKSEQSKLKDILISKTQELDSLIKERSKYKEETSEFILFSNKIKIIQNEINDIGFKLSNIKNVSFTESSNLLLNKISEKEKKEWDELNSLKNQLINESNPTKIDDLKRSIIIFENNINFRIKFKETFDLKFKIKQRESRLIIASLDERSVLIREIDKLKENITKNISVMNGLVDSNLKLGDTVIQFLFNTHIACSGHKFNDSPNLSVCLNDKQNYV